MISLPDDLRQLNDKLVEVNTSKITLQMKLDELEAAEVNIKVSYVPVFIGWLCPPLYFAFDLTSKLVIEDYFNLQYKERRMDQEKELLHDQMSWLQDELRAKTEELLSLSREKGNEILELKFTLENKEEEASFYFEPRSILQWPT